MRTLRTALTAVALCLLCVGYAASQIAYFLGNYVDYAARVDSPPVQRLAGLLLLSAIILALILDREPSGPTADSISPEGAGPGVDDAPLHSVDLRFTTYDLLSQTRDFRAEP